MSMIDMHRYVAWAQCNRPLQSSEKQRLVRHSGEENACFLPEPPDQAAQAGAAAAACCPAFAAAAVPRQAPCAHSWPVGRSPRQPLVPGRCFPVAATRRRGIHPWPPAIHEHLPRQQGCRLGRQCRRLLSGPLVGCTCRAVAAACTWTCETGRLGSTSSSPSAISSSTCSCIP